jgi:hypothetical protein
MSKKVIAIIIVTVIFVSLSGCSFYKNNDSSTQITTVDVVKETSAEVSEKWGRDFTLKEFKSTCDELINSVKKQTEEYGLDYSEKEIVRDRNEKYVTVENENSEKNKLQNMYISRVIYGDNLSSGKVTMKILLNFDSESAILNKDFDLGETSVGNYAKILTGIDKRDYGDINAKILEILNSEKGQGYFIRNIGELTEQITVSKDYIVYSLETIEYEFK